MTVMTKDQIRHQVINLRKTLILLESSVNNEDWLRCSHKERIDKWLKAQSILSGIHYCRGMLKSLTPEQYDYGLGDRSSVSGKEFYEESIRFLERLERTISEVYEDLKPVPRRLTPILPTIPKPVIKNPELGESENQGMANCVDSDTSIPAEEREMNKRSAALASDLLIDPPSLPPGYDQHSDPAPDSLSNSTSALLPGLIPPSTSSDESDKKASSVPGFLKTSTALHEDLSAQLAEMAKQLRRNAEQFNEALAADEGVLKGAQEKLEENYDLLSKERVRLRDQSGKSGQTTCFIFSTIIMVLIAFVMTFFVIRIT